MLDIAIKAAKEAGRIQKEYLSRKKQIQYKGEINLVTEVDTLCEQKIIEIIRQKFPDHTFLAEEGTENNCCSDYKWIIDPLDGTTNYAHGYPCFCSSIALEKKGKIIIGVIYDPILDQLFLANKGQGANLNGTSISVSSVSKLDKSLLVTGFPYDIRNNPEHNISNFKKFILTSQGVRRDGAAALDLCYLAMGRFDGFWESKLQPWDTAAGSLIVTEAGGKLSLFNGNNFTIYDKEIIASNGKIHDEMIITLNSI